MSSNQLSINPWFALNSRTRREKYVANILKLKGYEVFVPVRRVRRQWSDRIKEFEDPLFPGYIFCRFSLQDKLAILTVPGVLSVVGVGKTPIPVDEDEISAIRTIVHSGLPVESWPYLEVGHRVMIEYGPLRGLEGTLLNYELRKKKMVVSVTLLRRSIAVTFDAESISSAKPAAKIVGAG